MRQVTMSALFELGVRCATQESLWGSAAQALAGVGQFDRTMLSHMPTDCPVPAVSLATTGETAAADRT